ncbi:MULTISPECIES: sodium:proton antiporter [unclassified Siphonobacter]|uniref:cation:proton antiporter n=1 Tax=unclassified Siphonobacter TaxID=2635712 RepID=UPI000CC495AC|nr:MULTISPECIES: sodium:proton antiporter [unclassified Siphonobacter]MDQ1088296.1 CPA1 family monovalent cation:H+ antiporter [Siphonobacter sp. SORGH_AS_1065]MDR6194438.1 CPA1 family monovalent cation:H+ antiporter [Siphonobacter sp. SORGH_AS_0500]PKK37732.1 sodium:proton antiporter [Siphonobacter sp. SORGH_AS_0500]
MELYYTFSVLIVVSAIFAYLNLRYLKLPATIGIMVMALVSSLFLVSVGRFWPHLFDNAARFIKGANLEEILMGAMLNFLLFAGAIHIHINDLREEKRYVIVFSTISVVLSTLLVGGLMYLALNWLNMGIPFVQCLVFGALISPTDPIAVLGILKAADVPKSLETKIAGESLFNDGVAVVVFLTLLEMAREGETNFSLSTISLLLVKEAIGGLAVGLVLGFIGSKAIKRIDDYKVSVMITLAIVMGGYLLAQAMHISGPLVMVAAGLVVGNYGKTQAMSEVTQDYLEKFWELIDEIMNACLFLLIGFELLLIPDLGKYWEIGLISIVVVLLGRLISIAVPSAIIPFREKLDRQSMIILLWGGLRGGVSVALALSIDEHLNSDLFQAITYFVVVFSLIVQGLTVGKLTQKPKSELVNSVSDHE